MRRDIWDDPYVDEERRQPTVGGFVMTIIVMAMLVVLAGVVLGSCGVPWWALN